MNNGTSDALVLANPGSGQPALLNVYVHTPASRMIGNLRDGTLVVYYAVGTDWCTHFNTFTRDATYGRFDGVTSRPSDPPHPARRAPTVRDSGETGARCAR